MIPVYNLIKFSKKFLKAAKFYWQYRRDKPGVDDYNMTDSETLKLKQK